VKEAICKLNNSKYKITVLKCGGIGEYVFRICDSGDNEIYRNLENFVITDYSFSGYDTIN